MQDDTNPIAGSELAQAPEVRFSSSASASPGPGPEQEAPKLPIQITTLPWENEINAIITVRLMNLLAELVARGQIPPSPRIAHEATQGFVSAETAMRHLACIQELHGDAPAGDLGA